MILIPERITLVNKGTISLCPQVYIYQHIDIGVKVVYYHTQKKGVHDAGLLCQMSNQEGD